MTTLRIVRLLPDLLSINGSLGNAEILQARASWWGWKVTVKDVSEGTTFPTSADIVVIGHGTSSATTRARAALHTWSPRIRSVHDKGAAILGLGLGGDLLGQSLQLGDERLEGLGMTPIDAVVQHHHVSTEVWGVDREGRESAGYLNDLTQRPASPTPLISLSSPASVSGGEGHHANRIWVSAVSGPLLGLNPHIADDILRSHDSLPEPTERHAVADAAAAKARRAIAGRLGV